MSNDGDMLELSREEWDQQFPGREPAVIETEFIEDVFSASIVGTLGHMAAKAGIYKCIWRPDEIGITKASQLIEPLFAGLQKLRADPAYYEQFTPPNKWGTYTGLVSWVEKYLAACEEHPDADVSVCR